MSPHPLPDPALFDAVAARRGRAHAFPDLAPARTALVVIDMQAAFVAEGAPSEVPAARAIVPAINRLADALRVAGGMVAWVRATFGPAGWPLFFDNMLRPEIAAPMLAALQEGAPLHALWPELAVAPEDIVVPKYRFSAFLPGASALPAMLRGRGVDTVLIAGCMTNMCCELIGPRRGHDGFPHGHGGRRQRRPHRCRARGRALRLSHRLRRRANERRSDRLPQSSQMTSTSALRPSPRTTSKAWRSTESSSAGSATDRPQSPQASATRA